MAADQNLTGLWGDVSDAIKYQEYIKDHSSVEYVPPDFPEHINSFESIYDLGLYPIYIHGPNGSDITSTHSGGGGFNESITEDDACIVWVPNTGTYDVTGNDEEVELSLEEAIVSENDITIGGIFLPDDLGLGQVSSLPYAVHGLAGTSVPLGAIFAGGILDDGRKDISVTRYTDIGAKTYLSSFGSGTGRGWLQGITLGEYAIFAGGANSSLSTIYSTVDVYNASLARSTGTSLTTARCRHGAAVVGNYALFAGGASTEYDSSIQSSVEAYNKSLTKSTPTAMTYNRMWMGSASNGTYALFAGGNGYVSSSSSQSLRGSVEAYTSSLTHSITGTTAYVVASKAITGARVGNYALFVGGANSNSTWETISQVRAYDSSLTRKILPSLDYPRGNLCGTSFRNFAVFSAGVTWIESTSSPGNSLATYTFTEDLTCLRADNLEDCHNDAAIATAGDLVFIAGGKSNTSTDRVEYYGYG